jgi:hypothetical protein
MMVGYYEREVATHGKHAAKNATTTVRLYADPAVGNGNDTGGLPIMYDGGTWLQQAVGTCANALVKGEAGV